MTCTWQTDDEILFDECTEDARLDEITDEQLTYWQGRSEHFPVPDCYAAPRSTFHGD